MSITRSKPIEDIFEIAVHPEVTSCSGRIISDGNLVAASEKRRGENGERSWIEKKDDEMETNGKKKERGRTKREKVKRWKEKRWQRKKKRVKKEERKKGKRRASYSHYLTYYTGSMPPRPHFTWLHLAPLRSFSFAYRRPAPIMFFLCHSLRRSSWNLLSLYLPRYLRLSRPLYILFLPFPSIHSILSFSSIGTTTFSFSFPLFSFLPLCHYLILLAILFLFLLLSSFFFCRFTTPLRSRASLAHPLFPVSSPATTPTEHSHRPFVYKGTESGSLVSS